MTEEELEEFTRDILRAQDMNVPQRRLDALWDDPRFAPEREDIECMAETMWSMGYRKVGSNGTD